MWFDIGFALVVVCGLPVLAQHWQSQQTLKPRDRFECMNPSDTAPEDL